MAEPSKQAQQEDNMDESGYFEDVGGVEQVRSLSQV